VEGWPYDRSGGPRHHRQFLTGSRSMGCRNSSGVAAVKAPVSGTGLAGRWLPSCKASTEWCGPPAVPPANKAGPPPWTCLVGPGRRSGPLPTDRRRSGKSRLGWAGCYGGSSEPHQVSAHLGGTAVNEPGEPLTARVPAACAIALAHRTVRRGMDAWVIEGVESPSISDETPCAGLATEDRRAGAASRTCGAGMGPESSPDRDGPRPLRRRGALSDRRGVDRARGPTADTDSTSRMIRALQRMAVGVRRCGAGRCGSHLAQTGADPRRPSPKSSGAEPAPACQVHARLAGRRTETMATQPRWTIWSGKP